jgi:O-antigen/teichoic acid export membrane protein
MFWFFGGLGVLFLCLVLFAAFFWVWMLVDCLSRKRFKDKLVWVVVLLFLNFFGAILYYILVKSKD